MNLEPEKDTHQIVVKNLWKVFGNDPSLALTVENSGKSRTEIQSEFGQIVALRDVSFNVRKGETFVVMGLSGSGKSTLVRCLIRLIDATSGNIYVDGEDVTSFDDKNLMDFRRTKVSMVFQNFGLLPHRNVMDNACYGLEIKGMPRHERYEMAKRMIDLVGLSGWENSRVSQLSGGMQQRVGLARALAVEPEILLMDEPFSALDPLIRKDVQEILLELQSELHKTVVFITHDLDEALKLGDRIAILKDGKMDQDDLPVDILLSPKTEYVRRFVEDVNRPRVLRAKHIMEKLNGADLANAMSVDENDFIEKFLDKVVSEQPNMIAVQDKEKNNVGAISAKRLSEILTK